MRTLLWIAASSLTYAVSGLSDLVVAPAAVVVAAAAAD